VLRLLYVAATEAVRVTRHRCVINTMIVRPHPSPSHWLKFESLAQPGRGLAFPCDAAGHVDLDLLSDAALRNYLFARAVVGREFDLPQIEPAPDR
jgi:hypothetical protein